MRNPSSSQLSKIMAALRYKDQFDYAYVSDQLDTQKYEVRGHPGDPIVIGSDGSEPQIIAAEFYEGSNHLAVKDNLTTAIKTWSLDNDWDWDDLSETDRLPGSNDLNHLEILFDQDFDADGYVERPPKVYTNIETDDDYFNAIRLIMDI